MKWQTGSTTTPTARTAVTTTKQGYLISALLCQLTAEPTALSSFGRTDLKTDQSRPHP